MVEDGAVDQVNTFLLNLIYPLTERFIMYPSVDLGTTIVNSGDILSETRLHASFLQWRDDSLIAHTGKFPGIIKGADMYLPQISSCVIQQCGVCCDILRATVVQASLLEIDEICLTRALAKNLVQVSNDGRGYDDWQEINRWLFSSSLSWVRILSYSSVILEGIHLLREDYVEETGPLHSLEQLSIALILSTYWATQCSGSIPESTPAPIHC